ncbi:MAG: hypothetical protein HY421_01700 [Candidatus Kerfeldbacteria bacterium]|nr:hypothetical protein [Candidatus Kerfeldbacteria bacterium]
MSSTLLEQSHDQWFGTVLSDGSVVVNHKHRSCFTVHGLWNPVRNAPELSYTVVAYFPDGWPLKEALYATAQQFVVPVNGKIEHGPFNGVPHAFGVVIPVTELHADPRQKYAWLGTCLFKALLTAVEQTDQDWLNIVSQSRCEAVVRILRSKIQ